MGAPIWSMLGLAVASLRCEENHQNLDCTCHSQTWR